MNSLLFNDLITVNIDLVPLQNVFKVAQNGLLFLY